MATKFGLGAEISTPTGLLLFCSVLLIPLPVGCTGLLMPFCHVCRQFLGFLPCNVHVLQAAFHDVRPLHPVCPWPSRLPLISLHLSLCGLVRYSGVFHLLNMSLSFHKPVFFLMSAFIHLVLPWNSQQSSLELMIWYIASSFFVYYYLKVNYFLALFFKVAPCKPSDDQIKNCLRMLTVISAETRLICDWYLVHVFLTHSEHVFHM